jgi:hypothetical protein
LGKRSGGLKRKFSAGTDRVWRVRVCFLAERGGERIIAFSRAQLLDLIERTEERERDAVPERLH